jgi:hypothetical protein
MLNGLDGSLYSHRIISPKYISPIILADRINNYYKNECAYQYYDIVSIPGTKTIAISTDY